MASPAPPTSTALDVVVVRGTAAVMAQGHRIAALAAERPDRIVSGTWPWIAASVGLGAADQTPWLVALAHGDTLVAAAVLVDDDAGSIRRTTLAGTAEEHRGTLLATDAAAAAHLGAAVADALMADHREFAIGPVSHGPAVAALLRCLPVGLVIDEVAVPIVHADPSVPNGMSRGAVRTLRKAANRMVSDGVEAAVHVTKDGAEISGLLPLLASISRDRDLAAGRCSPLDDSVRLRLWQRRVRTLAAAGSLQLATLRLNGDLAAYVLGIEDGDAYRVLEGRYVARWARYAPGRVLESAVLEAAMANRGCSVFDWMTGIAPETLLAANDSDPLVIIRGRS